MNVRLLYTMSFLRLKLCWFCSICKKITVLIAHLPGPGVLIDPAIECHCWHSSFLGYLISSSEHFLQRSQNILNQTLFCERKNLLPSLSGENCPILDNRINLVLSE